MELRLHPFCYIGIEHGSKKVLVIVIAMKSQVKSIIKIKLR